MQATARLGTTVEQRAEALADEWRDLGHVTTRSMFGGRGVFLDGAMFAMVERDGTVRLKADKDTVEVFEDIGGERHGRMPYWSLPDDVVEDPVALHAWARQSVRMAIAARD
jgi:DNA transformation protein